MPNTATDLERDLTQLKKQSTDKVHEYLSAIPPATVEKIFKHAEIEPDIFSVILEAFSKHGVADAGSSKLSADFLMALAKSSSFEMAFMFVEDKERAFIDKIAKSLQKHDAGVASKFKSEYNK